MSEREAFGPNLRRLRVKRGISLESISAATKVHTDMWAGLERNDVSRWPAGIYARAYVRAYALQVGIDPDGTVDEFCRLFPNGDRRTVRVVREQAALVGHDLRWKDDLVGSVTAEKRSAPPSGAPDLPAIASTPTGRIVAAVLDLSAAVGASAAIASLTPFRWRAWSLAVGVLAYHTISLVALGSTPAVWALETYLTSPASHNEPREQPAVLAAAALRSETSISRNRGSYFPVGSGSGGIRLS